MCGINGFTWKDEALVRKMDEVTKHRGPDATSIFTEEKISLGHNRLSIIDLSPVAGQPMISDEGRYVIVYNGELYNYLELKSELTGYQWKTQGDTEVILAAYKQWGTACFKRFNGIFALAIWDTKTSELVIARDHNGIKPLYYHLMNNSSGPQLIFSSEIKAILEHSVPRVLCRESLSHYLRVLYVPEPYTMFKDIMKLPAAHFAVFKHGVMKIERYWEAPTSIGEKITSKKEAEQQLREQMAASIKRQLVSDRPVGIFLSGGLDSTVVLHHAADVHRNISTYSIGFDLTANEQEEKFNHDFNLARATAAAYNTNHHEVRLSVDDVITNLEQAIWHLDEPVANPTIIAQYVLSRFSKETVTVVLGGDGGDELFGGYDRYRFSLMASYYQRIPAFLRSVLNLIPQLSRLDIPAGVDRYAQFLFQKDAIIKEVAPQFADGSTRDFFNKVFFSQKSTGSFEEQFMDVDRRSWLTDESLVRSDKMTMASAIESRVPFLDKEIIEFAARIPRAYKFNFSRTKIIVRDAYRGHIPEFIYNQPKRGWYSPGAKWLRNEKIFKLAQHTLTPGYYGPTESLFDWEGITRVLNDHKQSKRYNSVMLWALIMFQMWAKRYRITLD